MNIERPEGGWRITRTPVHPGEMLREEFMKPLGISINELALELHVPVTRISQIVNEHRGITADTAIAFGATLRHERRFLDEPPEGLRIGSDTTEVAEDYREPGASPFEGCVMHRIAPR